MEEFEGQALKVKIDRSSSQAWLECTIYSNILILRRMSQQISVRMAEELVRRLGMSRIT
jgi:hypothetical protein